MERWHKPIIEEYVISDVLSTIRVNASSMGPGPGKPDPGDGKDCTWILFSCYESFFCNNAFIV